MVKNWENIHKSFYHGFKKNWEEKGFDYDQTKVWINIGLNPDESGFAKYLERQSHITKEVLTRSKLIELRNEYKESWADIHLDFTTELKKDWESSQFGYHKTRDWINIGLNPEDSEFANYLEIKGHEPKLVLRCGGIEKLREKYSSDSEYQESKKLNWGDISKDFNKKEWQGGVTHRQSWEKQGLTYQDAKEWIKIGFKLNDYRRVKEWKEKGFIPKQTQKWINAGLYKDEEFINDGSKISEFVNAEFANYLQNQGLTPETSNLKETRSQHWLEFKFDAKRRKEIRTLNLGVGKNKIMEGSLNLNEFVNLVKLECRSNKLTTLDLSECENLKEVYLSQNQLNTLVLPQKGNKLVEIRLDYNQLSDLSVVSHLKNLEELWLNKNLFFGSLEPLKNLHKLRIFYICDTFVDKGLEHLSDNLDFFSCKGTKLAEILNPYCPYHNNLNDYIYDYGKPYQAWRKDYQKSLIKSLEEENAKIDSLEEEILTLTKLIKQQKEKIIKAYLHFAPEKELLKEVIVAYLEYVKTKKKGLPSVKLRKQFETLRNELESKVEEEFAEEIETILNDCESLVTLELELESEITKRKLLLEDAYQKVKVLNITVNINEKIEAGGNVYLANIIKGHADLNYNSYQQEPKLEEMLENEELPEKEQARNDEPKKNYELAIISKKIEKNLIIKREEPIIEISGDIPEKAIIGNTFTGSTNLSHNQIINHHTKNIQGFNIEGNNNTFTNPSVQGNTLEAITYEEETELQTSIEPPLPNKQLK